jgi:neutral ceramidase
VGELLAGVGRATITPPVGVFLAGYASRDHGSVRSHDDLLATALVLSDGRTRAAIVTCDLLMLHPSTVASIRSRIFARTGIPAPNVMLCCSHTHSGPVTFVSGAEGAWPERRAYLADLVELVVTAVVEADHSLKAAAWGVGRGRAEIGVNRRQRTSDGQIEIGENWRGAVDRDVLVLRVDTVEEGGTRPLALLVNHSCHAVCLSGNSYDISADWPGAMRLAIESQTPAAVAFVQGACADINPVGGPQDTFDRAQRLGTQVAREVLALLRSVALQRQVNLAAVHRGIGLPLWGPIGRDGEPVLPYPELVRQALGRPQAEAMALLDQRFPWTAHVEDRGGVWYTVAELQAISLNDVVLVGVAAEPFVEIGLQVKARSSAALTLFGGYTNGCVGYVPMPLAYSQGGYEVDASYLYYRLPAPLAPACAELIIGGALALIDTLEPLF